MAAVMESLVPVLWIMSDVPHFNWYRFRRSSPLSLLPPECEPRPSTPLIKSQFLIYEEFQYVNAALFASWPSTCRVMLIKAVTLQASIALATVLFLAVILMLNSKIWLSTTFNLIVETERIQKVSANLTLVMIPAVQSNIVNGTHRSTPHSCGLPSAHVSRPSSRLSQSKKHPLQQNPDQCFDKSTGLSHDEATLRSLKSKQLKCLKSHCKEYLSKQELLAMRRCLQQTALRTVGGQLNLIKSMIRENDCNFMDGTHRRPVALASSEGSGNTWVRGLLEKSTGICTGFLYCDYVMRREGFIGEMIKSGSVLVVKTHTLIPQWYGVEYVHPKRDEPYYGSAVYILRNPYKALSAEWNRRATNGIIKKKHLPHNESHTNVVPKEYWGKSLQLSCLHCCSTTVRSHSSCIGHVSILVRSED